MKLEAGETITLNNTNYQVQRPLGSGAMSDVYLAELDAVPYSQVVIKIVRDDLVRRLEADQSGLAPLTTGDRQELLRVIEGLRREAQVLTILNRSEVAYPSWPEDPDPISRSRWAQETRLERKIIALLDSGDLGPLHPFIVQEMAPAEFRRFDIKGWQDERNLIRIAHAIATVLELVHQHDLALLDFEPRTKGDRIRLQAPDPTKKQPFDLKIIDWNVTGGFQDAAQDLFFFGGHLYYFFLGWHVPLDQQKRPPSDLSTTPNWDTISEGSRQILQRLLHRDPRQRYQQAAHLVNDLIWWRNVLEQADAPNVIDIFQNYLWQARREDRYDRVLSVADLALRLDLPPEAKRSFEQRFREARDKLEEELWRPISRALATLWTGKAYAKAADEFQQQLQALPPEKEQARRARVYYQLALVGDLFKRSREGQDIRHEPAWQDLERASEALIKRDWPQAQDAIQKAIRQYPAAADWRPVSELLNMAQAGTLRYEADELRAKAEPKRDDSGREDWKQIEEAQIGFLQETVAKLEKAKQLDPLEPILAQQLQSEQEYLKLRQELLSCYRNADLLARQGREALQTAKKVENDGRHEEAEQTYRQAIQAFESAVRDLHTILEKDPAQYRAAEWLSRLQPALQAARERQQSLAQLVENHRRFDDLWSRSQEMLTWGRYSEALPLLQEATGLLPEHQKAQEQLSIAQVGAQLERLTQGYLETTRQHFRLRNLDEAQRTAEQALSFHGQPLSTLSGGQNLPPVAGMSLFVLRRAVEEPLRDLLLWIAHVKQERGKVQEAQRIGGQAQIERIVQIIDDLQAYLQEQGEILSSEESEWRNQANRWLATLDDVQQQLDQLESSLSLPGVLIEDGFERIHGVLDDLAEIPGDDELRNRAWRLWLRLVRNLPDLASKRKRLEEGRHHPLLAGLKTGQDFETWLTRVETAQSIERDLETTAGRSWPTWLDGPEADRKLQILAQILTETFPPGAGDVPPISRARITGWRSRLTAYLNAYLDKKLETVYKNSRQYEFSRALDFVGNLEARIPEAIRPPGWEQIQSFKQALETRRQAEKTMADILSNLERSSFSFQEAARRANKITLPTHPAVPVDDLKAHQAELAKAGEMEAALHETPAIDDYANLIYRRLTLAQEQLTVLSSAKPGLKKQIEKLYQQLTESQKKTAEDMKQELGKQAQSLIRNPTASPLPFLQLYWQCRWWRAIGPLEAQAQVQETAWLNMVIGTVDLAGKLRDRLDRLEGRGDLDTAQDILDTWWRFNRGLMANRRDDGKPLIQLPPLPIGKEDDYRPAVQKDATLDRIKKNLKNLDDLKNEQAERSASATEQTVEPPQEVTVDRVVVKEAAAAATETTKQQEGMSLLDRLFRRTSPSTAKDKPLKPPPKKADDQAAGDVQRPGTSAISQKEIRETEDRASRLDRSLGDLEETFQQIDRLLTGEAWTSLRAEAVRLKELARLLIETDRERQKGEAIRLLQQMDLLQAFADGLEARWAWLAGAEQARLTAAVRALERQLDRDLQIQVIDIHKRPPASAADGLRRLLAQLGATEETPAEAGPQGEDAP